MTTTRLCITGLLVFVLGACTPAEKPAGTVATNGEERIDLVILGDWVVTMDVNGTLIEDGAVAVDEGVIIDAGPASESPVAPAPAPQPDP